MAVFLSWRGKEWLWTEWWAGSLHMMWCWCWMFLVSQWPGVHAEQEEEAFIIQCGRERRRSRCVTWEGWIKVSVVLVTCLCCCLVCEVSVNQLSGCLRDISVVQLQVLSSGHCCVWLYPLGDRRGGRSTWIQLAFGVSASSGGFVTFLHSWRSPHNHNVNIVHVLNWSSFLLCGQEEVATCLKQGPHMKLTKKVEVWGFNLVCQLLFLTRAIQVPLFYFFFLSTASKAR